MSETTRETEIQCSVKNKGRPDTLLEAMTRAFLSAELSSHFGHQTY